MITLLSVLYVIRHSVERANLQYIDAYIVITVSVICVIRLSVKRTM